MISDLHQIHQLRPGHCAYQILRRGAMRAVLWDDGVVSGIRDDRQVALDIPYEVGSGRQSPE